MISSIASMPLELRGTQRNNRMNGHNSFPMNIEIHIGENAFAFQAHKSGQSVGVSYAAGSTQEDPIVHISGTAHSGKFDETVHLKDIDPMTTLLDAADRSRIKNETDNNYRTAENRPISDLSYDAWKDYGTAPLDDLAQFAEKFKDFNLDSVLSPEQLASLKEKYDLSEMTQESYEAMVNDLYEMGVFDEEMKNILLHPHLLKPVRVQGWKEISGTPFAYGVGYSEAGRVYDMSEGLHWQNVDEKDLFSVIKYLSSFDYYDPDRGGYCKTETGLVFDRLLEVLNKMEHST